MGDLALNSATNSFRREESNVSLESKYESKDSDRPICLKYLHLLANLLFQQEDENFQCKFFDRRH
jgi:hypothetical protein